MFTHRQDTAQALNLKSSWLKFVYTTVKILLNLQYILAIIFLLFYVWKFHVKSMWFQSFQEFKSKRSGYTTC